MTVSQPSFTFLSTLYLRCRVWVSASHISEALWPAERKVKVYQLCPIICDPMDYTVHGILQARILEWVAFPFSRGSSQSRDQTQLCGIARGFFCEVLPVGGPRGRLKVRSRNNGLLRFCYSCSITSAVGSDSSSQLLLAHGELVSFCSLRNMTRTWAVPASWRSEKSPLLGGLSTDS